MKLALYVSKLDELNTFGCFMSYVCFTFWFISDHFDPLGVWLFSTWAVYSSGLFSAGDSQTETCDGPGYHCRSGCDFFLGILYGLSVSIDNQQSQKSDPRSDPRSDSRTPKTWGYLIALSRATYVSRGPETDPDGRSHSIFDGMKYCPVMGGITLKLGHPRERIVFLPSTTPECFRDEAS